MYKKNVTCYTLFCFILIKDLGINLVSTYGLYSSNEFMCFSVQVSFYPADNIAVRTFIIII